MPDIEQLYNAIERASETAYGGDEGDLSQERASAIDAYLGRNTAPAPDGRSQVVDRTVYETIQWMLPSLARIFANGDDVVELPPLGPDDEEGAKQEAQYLNYLALQKNNWFEIFTTGAKDALLTKAGYLYAYREKRRQVEVEKYERQSEQGVQIILQDQPEVLNIEGYPDPDAQPQPQMGPDGKPMIDPMTGQPVMAPPPMLYDLEVRRTKEDVAYCIEALPPERVLVSEKHKNVQLVGCPYFEYFDWVSISELRRDGYDVDEDMTAGADPYEAPEDSARDRYFENESERNEVDPSMRRIRTRYVWITHDYDEDGIAELNYVVIVGKQIVHREESNDIPVGVLCPDPMPHRHIGLSVADNSTDIQEIKTAVWRQGLDNLYLSNNARTFASDKINLDDLLVSRPGGVVRAKAGSGAIYGQDFMPIQVPFVFPQAVEALGYLEQVTEGRTGVNRYFQGTDQNALNKTSSGIQQLSTMAAQRVEQIARHFANGIERLFAVMHSLVLKGGHKAESVKLSGQWVQIDPANWRKRTDFRISVGYAAGNKDAQLNRLMLIANMQEKALAGGLPIANAKNAYETALEITKASDLTAPGRFWTDPSTVPPPQPPQPDVTVMAMEQIKAQSAQQIKSADVQQKELDSQRDAEIEKYKADLASQTSLALEQMRQQCAKDIEQMRGGIGAQLESHKAQLNPKTAESNAKVKQTEGLTQFLQALAQSQQEQTQRLEQTLTAAFEGISKALQASNAPRRLVRDKSGRVERSEPVLQ